jgi:HEAT repeat protein
MGAEAAPAVPFLLVILGDSTPLELDGNPQGPTSPGQEAALALVKIGTLSVDPLIGALNYEDPTMRKHAAWALGKIEDPRAIRPLIETLSDDDPQVRSHAATALAEITGKSYGEDPIVWQNWLNEYKLRRCVLLELLIEMLRSSHH